MNSGGRDVAAVFFRWYRAEYEEEKYENFKENNT